MLLNLAHDRPSLSRREREVSLSRRSPCLNRR
jgi:hypothetical protein